MTNKKIFLKSFMFIVFLFLLVSCNETKYTLTIDANGGLIDGKEIQEIVKTSKDDDKKVVLNTPIRKGYEFVGWVKNGVVLAENYVELDSNMTVTAKYEIIKYNITYDLGEGVLDNLVYTYTVEDEINLGIPTKEGYDFTGWNLGITKIEKGSIGDVNLVANYSIKEYTIDYELNGGKFESEIVTKYTIEDEITLPIPVKDGYEFEGWYSDANFQEKNSVISAGSTDNKVYYAKWIEIQKRHNIEYELNGGTLPEGVPTTFIEGETFALAIPSKEGYKFLGWYMGSNLTGTTKTEVVPTDNKDIKVYAKWEKIPEVYTITYVLNGGAFESNYDEIYVEGSVVFLANPVREGYKFIGWYETSDFSGEKINVISVSDKGNKTYYACWNAVAVGDYTIEYVLNGGILEPGYVEVYDFGTTVKLPIPSKQGSAFMGWFENSSFEGDVVEKILATDKGNKKYYAMWMDVEEVFASLVPDTITNNLTLYTTHPDNSDIKLSWTSGNTKLISNTGVINQAHKTITTTLTMTMTYKGNKTSHTGLVNLAPVVFDNLSTGKTVVGYVYSGTLSKWGSTSFDGIFTSTALKTLDVVNYGFATVDANGNLVLNNTGYTKYLEEVLKLRQQGIRVLLCIGENSKNFSDMTFDTAKMNKFVSQVIAAVEEYHFDGVDIDWEFPGVSTGRDVSVDRPNYTKLIKALRSGLDKAQESGGTKYLLTAAIPGTSWGSERYEMNILDNYLDYVNMMSYDLNNESIACHHSSLHTSTTAKAYGFSIEYGVNRFVSLGFNKNQIVVGMAFYGKYYTGATALGKSATFNKNIHYTVIAKNYLGGGEYQQLWDDVAKAPYILNTSTGEYISYDNARSITEKCKYSKSSGIKGVMFWDYSEDTTGTLMKAIYDEMK